MRTTREIAQYLGCTPQAVNRAIKKACDAHGLDVSDFGTQDAKDKRIRTFSESELNLILEFAPKPKVDSEPVDAEVVATGEIVKTAQPLMPFSIQSLNISVTVANTSALEDEARALNGIAASGFGAISQLLQADLQAAVSEALAQNRHAVAGAQAHAAVSVAQSLGKPTDG